MFTAVPLFYHAGVVPCPLRSRALSAVCTSETAAPLAFDLFVTTYLTTSSFLLSPGCSVRSTDCSEFMSGPHQHGLQLRAQ